ncbi:hypothetical protein P261_00077 [Lachnospiraceae bacterium TWA4]|nr:hypothetical protein P261_00077 [Lachnospiraceae bacterium TWA4]
MNYEELLYLEHPTSKKHPRMSIEQRAAQFAPFVALTGYQSAIKETERKVNEETKCDECTNGK